MKKITLIGNGNMAFSIAMGLKETFDIEVVGRDLDKLNQFENRLNKKIEKKEISNFNISNKIIILCIKPINLKEVSEQLIGKADLLISVLAGISLKDLEIYNFKSIARAMPNISAEVKQSITIIYGDKKVEEIFNNLGDILWVNSEKDIDIATAISGSGPAYLSYIVEVFIKAGINNGLSKEDSEKIVKGLFKGFGSLLDHNKPKEIIDKVKSPNGTTEEAINFLEENNVSLLFQKAIFKAIEKTKK